MSFSNTRQILSGLLTIFLLQINSLNDPVKVFSGEYPCSLGSGDVPDQYNPSLAFPSTNLAILSDGKGKIFLLETGNRSEQQPWKVSEIPYYYYYYYHYYYYYYYYHYDYYY